MKAYSYIRFSSPEQAKGDSYRRQRQAAEAFCDENGLELASSKEYTFLDRGRSAYSGRHLDDEGQLRRFLNLVESGEISAGSYLLVESLDRLSREKVNTALPRFMDILNKGIKVVTLADRRVYDQDFSELDLIISIVHMSRAHSESSIKSHRLTKVWEHKKNLARERHQPVGHACPHWLELRDGVYQPIVNRVLIVREIFRLGAEEGRGKRAIAKILNERAVPVFGSAARNKNNLWSDSSVGKLLNNKALIGEYQPTHIVNGQRVSEGAPIEGYYPPVIDTELFYQVQAGGAQRRLHKSTKQSKRFNLWQGVGKCDHCGNNLHLVNKGRPPKGYVYIICSSQRAGKCDFKAIRLEKAELAFKEVLAKIESISLVEEGAGALRKAAEAKAAELSDLEQRRGALLDLMEEAPSRGLAELLSKTETAIEECMVEQENLNQRMSRKEITNKEEFFARLDLSSYSGRSQANSLLKRLGLTVKIGSLNLAQGRKYFFHVFETEAETGHLRVEISTFDFERWDYFTVSTTDASIAMAQGDMMQQNLDQAKKWEELERHVAKYKLV